MDNLTHSLFGLTLARTPLGRAGRGATIALLVASNAPDIDIVSTVGGVANYLHWHRGPTHGPLGVVGLGLVSAAVAWMAARSKAKPDDPPASFSKLWLIAMVGVLCHILMDLPTTYGTRVLSPFSWTWFAEDWMPIVDVYLLAILAGGFVFARGAGARRRSIAAAVVIVLTLVNYTVRGLAHHQAVVEAPAVFGASLPERCDDGTPAGSWIERWPRPSALSPRDQAARRCLVEIAALPNFLSPFRWRLIAQLPNAYELRDTNLLDRSRAASEGAQLVGVRFPNQWTPAVIQAAQSPIAQVFLGFSRFPAARSSLDAHGSTTVLWTDLRFITSPLGGQRLQGSSRFGVRVLVGADGGIGDARLGP